MNIQVNGEKRKITRTDTLDNLIKKLNPSGKRIAVLINDDLIPADQRAGHVLNEGDRVEILTFAGGG